MRQYIILLIVLSIIFLSGCQGVDLSQVSNADLQRVADKAIVCNSPYIRFGTGCCLDQNNNTICDTDEKTATTTTQQTEANTQNTNTQCTNECQIVIDDMHIPGPYKGGVELNKDPKSIYQCQQVGTCTNWVLVETCPTGGYTIYPSNRTAVQPYKCTAEGPLVELECVMDSQCKASEKCQDNYCVPKEPTITYQEETKTELKLLSISQPTYAAGAGKQSFTYELTYKGQKLDILNYCYQAGGNGCATIILHSAEGTTAYIYMQGTSQTSIFDLADPNKIEFLCNYIDDDPGKNRLWSANCLQNIQKENFMLTITPNTGTTNSAISSPITERIAYKFG